MEKFYKLNFIPAQIKLTDLYFDESFNIKLKFSKSFKIKEITKKIDLMSIGVIMIKLTLDPFLEKVWLMLEEIYSKKLFATQNDKENHQHVSYFIKLKSFYESKKKIFLKVN